MKTLFCVNVWLALLLTGCAIAPAKVKRSSKADGGGDLHALLTQALVAPESEEGRQSLGRFIERWKSEGRGESGDVSSTVVSESGVYRVSFQGTPWGEYPIGYFDEISPAADFEVTKLKHHQRAGVGVPMTALRENRHQQPLERFYPPEAITRPLTAFAKFGKTHEHIRDVRIQLLCPLVNPSIDTPQGRQPLAADFSVPWAALLARSGKLNQLRVLDMLSRMPKRQPQLYLMEPYDPKKEPLIMIHGLVSTPLVWAELSNDLWADDAIRQRYQIWHYLYNTSAPALYSTRLLRTQLRELRQLLDPEGDDPAMQKTTLLTHSMGGLVGKALAMKPGDAFWKAAFNVPQETLKLTPPDRAMLNDAFEWQPDRAIHRIIFIAVPHRGSAFADNTLGRIGSWLTKPPSDFQAFYDRISKANPGVFTPAYDELGRGVLDSVHSLSPMQPTLHILARLPFAQPVKVHSIIGNRGKPGPLEQSSDGIVPYTSSHLDGVVSEKIVPAGHGAFRDPQAVTEITRLLKL